MPVRIIQSVSKPALFVLFTVLFSMVISADESDGALSSNSVLPAGTVLTIPLAVMEKYQAEADFWGRPFNYFSYYYSLAGPDLDDISKSTYYFPLSREDGKKMDGTYDILVISILNLAWLDEEKGIFITRHDTSYDDLNVLYEYFIE